MLLSSSECMRQSRRKKEDNKKKKREEEEEKERRGVGEKRKLSHRKGYRERSSARWCPLLTSAYPSRRDKPYI